MAEIRLVNRAKWVLIDQEKTSEPEAHRFIEKQAMDRCVPRRVIAEAILQEYNTQPIIHLKRKEQARHQSGDELVFAYSFFSDVCLRGVFQNCVRSAQTAGRTPYPSRS